MIDFDLEYLFSCLSDVNLEDSFPLANARGFLMGIESLFNRDQHLVNERGENTGEMTEKEMHLACAEEVGAFHAGDDEGYQFIRAIAGIEGMGFYHFSIRHNLYCQLLGGMGEVDVDAPLGRDVVVEILKEMKVPSKSKNLAECLEAMAQSFETFAVCDPEGKDIPSGGIVIGSPVAFVEVSYHYDFISEMIILYDALRILEHGDTGNLRMLDRHIRNGCELNFDSAEVSAEIAGLCYLRLPLLCRVEGRMENDLRKYFDERELRGFEDEFRYHVAEDIGILDEEQACLWVNGVLKQRSFGNQYRAMSPQGRRAFDNVARERLEKIAYSRGFEDLLG